MTSAGMKRMTFKHEAKRTAMMVAVVLVSFYVWHVVVLPDWSGNVPTTIGMIVSAVIAAAVTESLLPRDAG
jgi:hypothetical protein